MPRLQTRLKLLDSAADIAIKIADAIKQDLTRALESSSRGIEDGIRELIRVHITTSDTYQSILHNELHGDLGLVDPEATMNNILQLWLNTIQVTVRPIHLVHDSPVSVMTIGFIQDGFSDVLSLGDAKYVSINRTGQSTEIPWLEWLLTAGNQILVRDYYVKFGSYKFPPSRSRKAVMVKGPGRVFKMPPQHAGTVNNNFVTRALTSDQFKSDVRNVIEREILARLR